MIEKEKALTIINKFLVNVFEMGLRQSPFSSDNSDFYLPLIELKLTPELYKKLSGK